VVGIDVGANYPSTGGLCRAFQAVSDRLESTDCR